MPNTAIQKTQSMGGVSFSESRVVTADNIVVSAKSQGAAQGGAITSSVVTMTNPSHTIEAADRVDVYWTDGIRLGCLVDSVVTDQVTLSGGAGDSLPTGATAVTLNVPTEINIDVTGDSIQSILLYSAARGGVVFADVSDVSLFAQNLAIGGTYDWFIGNGDVNPLAGDVVAKVFVSHESVSASEIRVGVGYNN